MTNLYPSQVAGNDSKRTTRKKTIIAAVIGLVIMVAVFAFLFPKFADYQKAFAQIADMSTGSIVALVLASMFSIFAYPLTAIAAIPHLRYRAAFTSRQVSFLISNVIPGGGPVAVASQYAVLAGYGIDRVKAVAVVSADAAWTYLITLGAPSIAVVTLIAEGRSTVPLLAAAATGLVIVIVSVTIITITLRSDTGAHRMGDILQRPVNAVFRRLKKTPPDISEPVIEFHDHVSGMVAERWQALTVTSVAAQMSPFIVLVVAIYGLGGGGELTIFEMFAAYSIAILTTMIPLTPGGLGTSDAALVALLTAFGADPSLALAADLVWRLAWFLPQLGAGLIALALYGWDKRQMNAAEHPVG